MFLVMHDGDSDGGDGGDGDGDDGYVPVVLITVDVMTKFRLQNE